MTFQVGDVVVCVDAMLHLPPAPWNPQVGHHYRVIDAGVNNEGDWFVDLAEDPFVDEEFGWAAEMFRPLTRADEQFTASIRACRDAHSPAPVA